MESQRTFGLTPWVWRLLVANLFVYLLQVTIFLPPGIVLAFGFDPLHALARPWTFVSYMFLHAGALHLAFNMLALYMFGPPVEERMGGSAFLTYYFVCGLGGAALSLAMAQVFSVPPMIGASGAIYGVMLAFAWNWPNQGVLVFPI